jgi:penicillin-insensitive murein endopeptidase
MLRGVSVAFWLLTMAALDGGSTDGGAPDAGVPAKVVVAKQWQAQRTPSAGPSAAIGTCSLGCLKGAAPLPASGPGFEVIRRGRNRYYGHPDLIRYVRKLGAAAKRGKLGLVVVGDLAQPRGGPTPTGHRSHQTGLDADISYAAPPGFKAGRLSARDREQASPVVVVDLKTHKPTKAWKPRIARLLALAAADPTVDRIFVNPAVKRWLCEGATAKAPWQGRVRPWWAHHDHFHVRLKCPADSPLCVAQEPPTDDGCGDKLAWWFSDHAHTARARKKQTEAVAPPPQLPPACATLIDPR